MCEGSCAKAKTTSRKRLRRQQQPTRHHHRPGPHRHQPMGNQPQRPQEQTQRDRHRCGILLRLHRQHHRPAHRDAAASTAERRTTLHLRAFVGLGLQPAGRNRRSPRSNRQQPPSV